MKKEKKHILFWLFLKMSMSFILVFFIWNFFVAIIPSALTLSKYSFYFIAEAFFALMVLIVMLLSNNSYVFTTKKEKFFKSLIPGIPILVFSIIVLIFNIIELESFNFFNTIGVLLYCIAVGLAEEFLCRGWLQNEFIERYSKTRKQVVISIILSSLIFGFMHISNVNYGQTIFDTFLQIAQATASGFLLGSIYFRTKNIWSVVFLHAFYDFSIMIGEANVIKSCTTTYPTTIDMTMSVIGSILIMLFWILGACINLRKSKIEPLITSNTVSDERIKKDKVIKIVLINLMIIIFISILIIPSSGESICYDYVTKEINNIETHYTTYDKFYINYINNKTEIINGIEEFNVTERINLYIAMNDDGYIVIKNQNTNDFIMLEYEYVKDFIVIENEDSYSILIYNEDLNDLKVYYKRLYKDEMSNDINYLNDIKNFSSFDVPEISKLGYLTTRESNYIYPMMESSYDGYFIIDDNNLLYLIG